MALRPLAPVALALALALALFLSVRPASAEVRIERYALDVTVPPAGQTQVDYTLTLVYRAEGERKTDGFKFVGREPIDKLWATDARGAPMRARVSLESSSREYKIDFGLPPPDADGRQTVKVGFLQSLDVAEYGWGYRMATIQWAPMFRVPVASMEVNVIGPRGYSGPLGFTCRGGETVVCSRVTEGTRFVQIGLPFEDSG